MMYGTNVKEQLMCEVCVFPSDICANFLQTEEKIKASVYMPMRDTVIYACFLWSAGCTGRAKLEALSLSLSGWEETHP